MMRKTDRPMFSVVLLLIFVAASCSDDKSMHETAGLDSALLFGEGIISTELPEFATSFLPDGQTVFFNRTNAERSAIKIMVSTKSNGTWGKPEPLSFSDGTYFDVDPFVSPDGSRVYFSSNRPVAGDSAKDFDTWYIEKAGGGWSEPVNLGAPLNGSESEVFFSMTKSQVAYFSISIEGIRKIYRSALVDGMYQAPEIIALPVADSVSVGNPLIDPNEAFLLFTSSDLEGFGHADIFIANHLGGGRFGEVRNAGEIVNSPYSDFAPALSPDGNELYFTSERPGVADPIEEGRPPGDLYKVRLEVLGPGP